MVIPAPILLGVVMGVISLIGLVMASQAHDQAFYYTGLVLFLFGVLFVFALIHRYIGRKPSE